MLHLLISYNFPARRDRGSRIVQVTFDLRYVNYERRGIDDPQLPPSRVV